MNDLVSLYTLFFKLVEDYHLDVHYSKEANLYSTSIPGDQNQFVKLAGSLLSFGYLFGTTHIFLWHKLFQAKIFTRILWYIIEIPMVWKRPSECILKL